jgi:hypothetical protein
MIYLEPPAITGSSYSSLPIDEPTTTATDQNSNDYDTTTGNQFFLPLLCTSERARLASTCRGLYSFTPTHANTESIAVDFQALKNDVSRVKIYKVILNQFNTRIPSYPTCCHSLAMLKESNKRNVVKLVANLKSNLAQCATELSNFIIELNQREIQSHEVVVKTQLEEKLIQMREAVEADIVRLKQYDGISAESIKHSNLNPRHDWYVQIRRRECDRIGRNLRIIANYLDNFRVVRSNIGRAMSTPTVPELIEVIDANTRFKCPE